MTGWPEYNRPHNLLHTRPKSGNFLNEIMGRKPIPDAKKALQGTLKKCRAREATTPATGVCKPITKTTPPSWLTDKARKIYGDTAKMLISWKVLTKLDLPLLAAYAAAYANLIAANDDITQYGYFVTTVTDKGTTRSLHPAAKMFKDSLDTVNKIGAQFGLSPVSRRSLDAVAGGKKDEPKKEEDQFAEFFK